MVYRKLKFVVFYGMWLIVVDGVFMARDFRWGSIWCQNNSMSSHFHNNYVVNFAL